MSIKGYLKDHGICILIFLIGMGITEGIFLLFNVSITLQIFVLTVLFLGLLAAGIYDYSRKKGFYRELEQKLQQLEEKYLLMEMLEKPEFLEGQIFYDVLSEMQKSMNDEIFVQIRKNNEFKRYIETWVHEVKLPIASIRLILHEYKGTSARILKEQMGRIESYVEQVLYYLRSEVPEKDYRIAPHSLKKLTDQSVSENRDSLILNRIKIIQETQDISVYTDWSYDSIKRGFEEKGKLFYILTNSRGFTVEQTTRAHLEIGETAAKVSEETGIDYVIVSRGDSTLRGYYPLETELLARAEEKHRNRAVDGEIICPYFKEGGRFTIGNVHYVKYGNELVPAGETEFAQDKTFGYHCSNLKDYVEEKTGGRYPAREVLDISLEELRSLDYSVITDKLLALHDFGKIVVNAVDACDLKVFCIALYDAMKQGRRFMFRTAAGFVKEFGAVSDRPLLSREEMVAGDRKTGGIIVVGSHTKKTTSQLEELKAVPGIRFLEFNSDLVLDEEKFQEEIQSVVRREEELLEQGVTVAVYTKRKLLSLENDSPEAALTRSVKISDAVQSLVGGLKVTPGFVVAKGGITSSDVGTKALKVKKATVLGQVRPGIPVWRTGAESRFPGIPYVIFPGNVGEAETLKETVEILMGSKG